MTLRDAAHDVGGVILAGGQARRMGGRDKGLVMLGSEPLVAHVNARLAPQVSRMAISANGDPDRFSHYGIPVLPDSNRSLGPLSGVFAALVWAQGAGLSGFVSAPVDAPFLPDDLVARLAHDPETAAIARTDEGPQPTFAYWPSSCLVDVSRALGSERLRLGEVAVHLGAREVHFDDASAFANLNTPEDIARAQDRL